MPWKETHIWNTFELPRQKTTSPSSAAQQDKHKIYQTDHTCYHVPLKTPFHINAHSLNVLGHYMLHGQTLRHNIGAPSWAALLPPTSCPLVPRIPKVGSEEAGRGRETLLPMGNVDIALPWSYRYFLSPCPRPTVARAKYNQMGRLGEALRRTGGAQQDR